MGSLIIDWNPYTSSFISQHFRYTISIMQIFQKNNFLWFTLSLSLLLEVTLVGAWSRPTFGQPGRETRDADARRRYYSRRTSNRGRSNNPRFNVGQVVGGTVLAGGAAATGFGLLTGNSDLTNAGITSVLAGGALKGISSLIGKK